MAAFELDRHGNPRYGAPDYAEQLRTVRARQGKVEKSLLSFAACYPTWRPSNGHAADFLARYEVTAQTATDGEKGLERGMLEVPGVAIPGAWALVAEGAAATPARPMDPVGRSSIGSPISVELQRVGGRVYKSATGAAAGGFNAVPGGRSGVWEGAVPSYQRSAARIQAHTGATATLPEITLFSTLPAAHSSLLHSAGSRGAITSSLRGKAPADSPRVSSGPGASIGSPGAASATLPGFEAGSPRVPARQLPGVGIPTAFAPSQMRSSAGSAVTMEASRSSKGNIESFEELQSSGEVMAGAPGAGTRDLEAAASAMAAPGAGLRSRASTAGTPLSRSIWSNGSGGISKFGEMGMGVFQGAEARQLALHRALQAKYEAALPLHQQARLSASVASFYSAHSG
jgi:hypothetical protein